MARKKSKKARKRQQQKLMNAPVEQMIRRGSDCLAANKPRDAINILQTAFKKGRSREQISTLLFRAYHLREAQLRTKGMHREADVVHALALDLEPDYTHLSETDLVKIIAQATLADAIDHYVSYLRKNTPSARIELFLAGRLFLEQGFHLLDALDDSVLLKRDAGLIKGALTLMNRGEWENAFARLKTLSRSSPFAPAKLFCRAICCFYDHDDNGMQRALAMIPAESSLKAYANKLTLVVHRTPCLWDQKLRVKQQIELLIKSLKKRQFYNVRKAIFDLTQRLFPQNQEQGVLKMLELLIPMVSTGRLPVIFFSDLVEKLLPKHIRPLIRYKGEYCIFENPVKNTNNYLSVLDKEFPQPDQCAIAHSLILLNTAKMLHEGKNGVRTYDLPWKEKLPLLGISCFRPDQYMIDMTIEGIRLDPLNRNAIELLADLPRYSRAAKTKVEQGLTMLMEAHPDDPRPCLELATLFYEKNAFRKAENILAEALKRAPHDRRVNARHVIALLISASKNLQRNRLHLTQKDLEKAAKLTDKSTQNLVIEKQILFKLYKPDQLSLFDSQPDYTLKQIRSIINSALDGQTPFDQLRIIGLLILDLENNPIPKKKKIQQHLKSIFNKYSAGLKTFSSREICQLLASPGKEVYPLYKSLNIAFVFLERKNDLTRLIDDDDIIPVIDILIKNGSYQSAINDLQRRMDKKDSKHLLVFSFYEAFLEHKLDGNLRDGDLFDMIIDDADKAQREMLRGVARRLAKFADGRLKEALERFDFSLLDDFSPFGFHYGNYDDDFDDDDDFIDDFLPGGGVNGPLDDMFQAAMVIELLEMMIDSLDLRDAPKQVIQAKKKELQDDKKFMEVLNGAKAIIKENQIKELSREAKLFLS